MKRRKKKELDKTIGEELLKSKHKCFTKVALPLSCKCSGTPVTFKLCLQLLILECKRGLQSFQGWNTKCFVFFSKHPQQIKCTCISLKFATVQLICGILSCSLPLCVHPAGFQQSLVCLENTYSHACVHTLLLSVLPFLNSVLSCICGIKDTLNSLICDFFLKGGEVVKESCFKHLCRYPPASNRSVFTKFTPYSLNWSLKLMFTNAREMCILLIGLQTQPFNFWREVSPCRPARLI